MTTTLPPRCASYTRREVERLGAVVQRWHVRPGMQQTVADHTMGMQLLALRLLSPQDLTINLLVAILEHDLGEVVAGDTPAPIKRHVKEFGKAYQAACAAVDEHYGLTRAYDLNGWEDWALHALDVLEALLWSVDCRRLGNHHAERTFAELYQAIADMHARASWTGPFLVEVAHARREMQRLGGFHLDKAHDWLVQQGIVEA